MNTGFESDDFFKSGRLFGLYAGTVVNREDPNNLCRVKVSIPGVMEITNWASPKGSGTKNFGSASVPPLDSDVYVQFINGNPDQPVYEPADFGIVNGESEVFKEHTDPDIHVFGIGPFRAVIDYRNPGSGTLRIKMVKEINGSEEDISWIEFSELGNSIEIHADSAIGVDSGAIIDIDSSTVQIKERKIMSTTRPIN